MKKSLRIRKFMILSLFLILTMPWMFYVAAHFFETNSFRLDSDGAEQENLQTVMDLLETSTHNWTDPTWQNYFSHKIENVNIEVEILSPTNERLFQSFSESSPAFSDEEKITIIEDGEILGRVTVYHSSSPAISRVIATTTGLFVAFVIVGMLVRNMIIKPLEKMSHNARQIAAGDLDVQLPESWIREIAEVRDGFQVMVSGLKEAFQKQRESEEERRFLIAAVAHDLRTPLFALRGYLDGLEQGIADTPEKRAKYLAVCKEKSLQLDRLVEDLFTFTKTEYVETELNETVDMTTVINQSIESVLPQAEEKQISIIADAENDIIALGDAHLLERAISSLLDNAIRHSQTHGKVYITCNRDRDRVTFSVRDTGAGFKPDELQRVFEPLFRGEQSRSRSTGGAGLGLSISQRIMKLHGGDLVATNHREGGALISGWLPIAK